MSAPSPKKTKNKAPMKLKKYSVSEKLEIIEMRDNGASQIKIAQEKGMNESLVRGIYRNKDSIKVRGKKN